MIFKKWDNSISKRLMLTNLSAVGLVLIVVAVAMSVMTWNDIYSKIEQRMETKSLEVVNMFSSPSEYSSPEDFDAVTSSYVQYFPDKSKMEVMNISADGVVLLSSTGFSADREFYMPDYREAVTGESGKGKWIGRLKSGELVMAISRSIYSSDDQLLGTIRYVVSLTKANRIITLYILVYAALALVILVITTISCSVVTNSILVPISNINIAAKRISDGDFDGRIPKKRQDEMGQLIDTINEMAEELGANEKLKNEFISSVSHELRTPLTSIEGWAETLQSSDMDPETRNKGMQIIIHETRRLSGLVEELLDFSRLQSGHLNMNMDRLDVLTELDEVVFLVSDRIESEGKILNYDTPAALPPVRGDANRLRQVFMNLLDNAIKYSSEGDSISVTARETEGEVQITVSDTGCGISESDLKKVRKKFYKVNSQVRGSGIGLAIADEIMELHEGCLEMKSKLGEGTTVTVHLSLTAAENTESKSKNSERNTGHE